MGELARLASPAIAQPRPNHGPTTAQPRPNRSAFTPFPGLRQAQTRSHSFFYRATGADKGLLGLPVVGSESTRRTAYPARSQASAAVVVLRQRGLSFTALGELTAQAGPRVDDGCKASCTDWYGNAQPIFLGERVIALLGYELVEGQLQGQGRGERTVEQRRINFSPRANVHLQMRSTPFD